MSDLGNKEIFSNNLRKYMELNGKDRKDIAKDLEVSYSTFTDWVNGNSYPRIDKIEKLANYFGIEKSDLIEKHKENKHYLNEDVRQIAQELFERKDLRILFDTTRKVKPEDIKYIQDLVDRLKEYWCVWGKFYEL